MMVSRTLSISSLLLLSTIVTAAPNPWGSYLNWSSQCRPCQDSQYERCGGGAGTIRNMVSCICTDSTKSSLAICTAASCPSEEASRMEDQRLQYCSNQSTSGQSGVITTTQQTGSVGGFTTTTSQSTQTRNIGPKFTNNQMEVLLGAIGVIALGV